MDRDAVVDAHAVLDGQVEQIAASIPATDAELRAGLMIATMLGVTVARGFLRVDSPSDASPEQIIDLLRPGFDALATATREPSTAPGSVRP